MIDLAAVLPLVAAGAAATEREGRLAALEALHGAGLFRLLLPGSVGGLAVAPGEFLTVVEALAGADASTGWCVAQTSVCSMAAALLPLGVARTVFADRAAILAWGHGRGEAAACAGGWRLSGSWAFGSGGRHATWLGGSAVVEGRAMMLLFPQAAAVFEATWDVVGLRGTGSDAYSVRDLFVPAGYGFAFGDAVAGHAAGPLYALPHDSLWAAGFASVGLGVARALVDALIGVTAKTPRGLRQSLAEGSEVQALVAGADAALRSARLFLHAAVGALYGEAVAAGAVSLGARMDVRLAASHALREARAVAERAYHAAGAGAVFAAGPFERRVRDMHAIGQHVHARQQHFETVGAFMLGGAPDLAFL